MTRPSLYGARVTETNTLLELMVAQREAEARARLASDGLLPGLALAIALAGIAVTAQRDAGEWAIAALYYVGAFSLVVIVGVLMFRSKRRHEAAALAGLVLERAQAAVTSQKTAEIVLRQRIERSHRLAVTAAFVASAALGFTAGRRTRS